MNPSPRIKIKINETSWEDLIQDINGISIYISSSGLNNNKNISTMELNASIVIARMFCLSQI